jgi:hypothetical protein
MLRMTYIVLIALLIAPCISVAGTIDVRIKGVDDGVKTTKQQDYKEAVLFAKREAIERAGVKVKALTAAKDFVIHSDYIESKAEAVLLPGYDVIDVGYQQNGTYLVILNGKVKTSTPPASSDVAMPKVIERDGRFAAYDNGTVKDTKTGLMWAPKDNREDINWQDARQYCENYRGGGYADWRMATQDELAELYDQSEGYQVTQKNYNVHLTELIELSACCPWASETRVSGAAIFGFGGGRRGWYDRSGSDGGRALPVRGSN